MSLYSFNYQSNKYKKIEVYYEYSKSSMAYR